MGVEKTIENLSTDELIKLLRICGNANASCDGCVARNHPDGCINAVKNAAADRIKQLQQELIDERDRYDRLVSFELDEAELLRAAKGEDTVNVSPVGCPSSVPTKTQNVVLVQFCKGGKKYLYALPKRSKIRKGMKLVVNAENIGYACCDNFLVGGAALDALVELAGAKLPLAFVSGVVLDLAADE